MRVDLHINIDNLKAQIWQVSDVGGIRASYLDKVIDARPSNEFLIREGFVKC